MRCNEKLGNVCVYKRVSILTVPLHSAVEFTLSLVLWLWLSAKGVYCNSDIHVHITHDRFVDVRALAYLSWFRKRHAPSSAIRFLNV